MAGDYWQYFGWTLRRFSGDLAEILMQYFCQSRLISLKSNSDLDVCDVLYIALHVAPLSVPIIGINVFDG